MCDYRSTGVPRASDFSIGNGDIMDISRSFNEAMDIYLTTLYDREFGS